jgi:MarC family membrane protein
MDLSLLSATILLLVVLDPIGNIPIFIATVEQLDSNRRVRVITRECFIAYLILILFAVGGDRIMGWMHLSEYALGISGGIVLFIIALRMIFRHPDGLFGETLEGEPLIFPLAVPLFAGPSAIAVVLLMTTKAPDRLPEWILSITIASVISTVILGFGSHLFKFIGKRGMRAMETLLGLLLTAVAIQMLLDGMGDYLAHAGYFR